MLSLYEAKQILAMQKEDLENFVETRNKTIQKEVLSEIAEDYPLLLDSMLEDSHLSEMILLIISKSVTKGMESISNKSKYVEEYLDENGTINVVGRYEFESGKGVSGILLDDGTFHKCLNGEHFLLVENLKGKVKGNALYFSSLLDGIDGVVSKSPFNKDSTTIEQKLWLKANFIYMDNSQRRMIQQKYS